MKPRDLDLLDRSTWTIEQRGTGRGQVERFTGQANCVRGIGTDQLQGSRIGGLSLSVYTWQSSKPQQNVRTIAVSFHEIKMHTTWVQAEEASIVKGGLDFR